MTLVSHPYQFFSKKDECLKIWQEAFYKLIGDKVLEVLGVWDNYDAKWFDNAPMLVKLTSGTMTVNVRNNNDLSIGWNDICELKKPVWFDTQEDIELIKELNWKEDLIWKKYDDVILVEEKVISNIFLAEDNYGLIGIKFVFSDNTNLIIKNIGDAIAANYML